MPFFLTSHESQPAPPPESKSVVPWVRMDLVFCNEIATLTGGPPTTVVFDTGCVGKTVFSALPVFDGNY